MSARIKITLGDITSVFFQDDYYFSFLSSLVELLPDRADIFTELTGDNREIKAKLDGVRFEKEAELAKMLGLTNYDTDKEQQRKLLEAIGTERNSLPEEQERKKREILFLLGVANQGYIVFGAPESRIKQ